MLIQCKIPRKGGTIVTLGTRKYHFKANDEGDHVAEVTDPTDIDRLLAISEGYSVYHAAEVPAKSLPLATPSATDAPVSGEAGAGAPNAGEGDGAPAQPNEEDTETETPTDPPAGTSQIPTDGDPQIPTYEAVDAMARDALETLHKQLFNRAAHGAAADGTLRMKIKQRLAQMRAETASE